MSPGRWRAHVSHSSPRPGTDCPNVVAHQHAGPRSSWSPSASRSLTMFKWWNSSCSGLVVLADGDKGKNKHSLATRCCIHPSIQQCRTMKALLRCFRTPAILHRHQVFHRVQREVPASVLIIYGVADRNTTSHQIWAAHQITTSHLARASAGVLLSLQFIYIGYNEVF
jgi:hypothetical protein